MIECVITNSGRIRMFENTSVFIKLIHKDLFPSSTLQIFNRKKSKSVIITPRRGKKTQEKSKQKITHINRIQLLVESHVWTSLKRQLPTKQYIVPTQCRTAHKKRTIYTGVTEGKSDYCLYKLP